MIAMNDVQCQTNPVGTTDLNVMNVSEDICIDEMNVNRILAKEFIQFYLSIPASAEHIEALAEFIFQLEHQIALPEPHSGNQNDNRVNVISTNHEESIYDKARQ